ncbi:MAG: transporter [Myxococcales bacterium]|nr:transporter [Myxococcales bacterium]MCB9580962.1 transporter [Polyangiaceae bacterium]
MSLPSSTVMLYVAIPVVAMVAGGSIAAYRPPTPRISSMIQHFAAGVVFAALGGEILPDLLHQHAMLPTAVGFSLGVALMLAVKHFTHSDEQGAASTRSLVTAVGVDVLIDGMLVGVGFAIGEAQGVLLTIALTLEVAFLSASTAAALLRAEVQRRRVIATVTGLAALLAGGAVIGTTFLSKLTGAPFVAVLGFAAAALLYLVTEELLVEAHEVPETPLTTAVFFVGFLLLFVIEMAL